MEILLISEDVGQRLRNALQATPFVSGFKICPSTEEACEVLRKDSEAFDLAVIDQELPDFPNKDFCRYVYSLGAVFPFVYLIPAGAERIVEESLCAGIESFLQKPANDEQLSALPAALLEIVSRHNDRIARKYAVVGMRKSRKTLLEIVAPSPVPMFIIDNDHRIAEWNQACEALTGLSAQEMVGKPDAWRAFFPEPKPTMADLIVDGLMETELAKHSGDVFRKSPLGDGYEAEDFFPTLGDKGKWLFITSAPLCNSHGEFSGAITTLQDVTKTRSAIEALERDASWLAGVLDGSSIPTFVLDNEHRVTHWNRACVLLTGLQAEDILGTRDQWRAFSSQPRPVLADLILDDTLDKELAKNYTFECRHALLGDGYEAEGFFPSLGKNGCWLFFTAAPIRSASGEVVGAIETLQDITERKLAEAALAESKKRLSQIIQASAVPTFVLDRDHRITEWNQACAMLTGMTETQMVGTQDQWKVFYTTPRPVLADLVISAGTEDVVFQHYGDKLRRSLLGEGFEAEDFFPSLGEGGKWLFFTAAPLRDTNGAVVGAIETLQDVTRRRNAEEALRASESHYRELSITDELTGLFNIRYFFLRAEEEISRAERYQHSLVLLMLDMDDFKSYNDTYGHPEGDIILKRFARCVQKCLRNSDSSYRYGGEEFVVLLPETSLSGGVCAAEKIRQAFAAETFHPTSGATIQKTMSIGVARWEKGETVPELLCRADSYLYRAKHEGKNRVVAQEK